MPEISILALALLLSAYLIGSLSSAVVLCKVAGLPDPRTQGSGNPGATNVLRFGGKKLAATVLIIDVLKGVIPVVIGRLLALDQVLLSAVALLAFLGHLYPVFFQFKGGKGVATALGAFLALSPLLALAGLLTWLVVFLISRISSLSAICAALMTPVYSLWLIDSMAARWLILTISLLLLWRHRTNIQRLLAGEEKKSG
ncbi:MAG: glycerol-3-phosphate 1-O-acyltransferase PlsY [Methylophaga sp.]|nr:glycerol-3-phosphate 1-O-acyltransferase PlsY [Methylophaga sp.]